MEESCVDVIVLLSGRRTWMGCKAGAISTHGPFVIKKWPLAAVSAIAVVVRGGEDLKWKEE
jgi:hypothetical protein